ncbi:hypothetical protein CEUSTIGMA_g11156.t1 [Chlamydomonas eustigma]|uniref:Uncharacterized protein n=1 Tax=Chlamydomonas eustigma TaxID=1157962 RepID=A0A250XKV7_9CHLO|nr:hypothetical protein CEUSTIGMA_g11156.t1 [Chlamydomonas eustigma]|eukprot:GAX83731.1 hypothetical protein CEUSTIGMA_g11156.t1 [Chlamydomonas eustigma]
MQREEALRILLEARRVGSNREAKESKSPIAVVSMGQSGSALDTDRNQEDESNMNNRLQTSETMHKRQETGLSVPNPSTCTARLPLDSELSPHSLNGNILLAKGKNLHDKRTADKQAGLTAGGQKLYAHHTFSAVDASAAALTKTSYEPWRDAAVTTLAPQVMRHDVHDDDDQVDLSRAESDDERLHMDLTSLQDSPPNKRHDLREEGATKKRALEDSSLPQYHQADPIGIPRTHGDHVSSHHSAGYPGSLWSLQSGHLAAQPQQFVSSKQGTTMYLSEPHAVSHAVSHAAAASHHLPHHQQRVTTSTVHNRSTSSMLRPQHPLRHLHPGHTSLDSRVQASSSSRRLPEVHDSQVKAVITKWMEMRGKLSSLELVLNTGRFNGEVVSFDKLQRGQMVMPHMLSELSSLQARIESAVPGYTKLVLEQEMVLKAEAAQYNRSISLPLPHQQASASSTPAPAHNIHPGLLALRNNSSNSQSAGVVNGASTQQNQAVMKSLLENMQSSNGNAEMEPPPRSLTMSVMKHQKLALAWMLQRELSGCGPKGGFLADDQGLGKTVSTISLMVTHLPGTTDDLQVQFKEKKLKMEVDVDAGEVGPSSGAQLNQDAACGLVEEEQDYTHAATLSSSKPLSDLPYGGTLVVCPTSVLHQWAREIREKVSPLAGFSLHVYHGKERHSEAILLARYSAVLTTFSTLAGEAPAQEKQNVRIKKQGSANAPITLDDDDEGGGPSSKPNARKVPKSGGVLYHVHWHRVVLDEAQSIKNHRTLCAHAAWGLHAQYRWCLSGTPIQNTIEDLFSYFKFLKYSPYNEQSSFKHLIKDKISANPDAGYKLLQAILQPVLLRRTKASKLNGEPIINIPPRELELAQPQFSRDEASFYQQIQLEGAKQLKEDESSGSSGRRSQYVNILYSLLKLRQACNHPWLVKGIRGKGGSRTGKPSSSDLAAAKKLPSDVRQGLLESLLHPLMQCPVCMDVPEDPVVSICGHVYCKQCASSQLEGSGQDDEFCCVSCSRVLRGPHIYNAAALEACSVGSPKQKQHKPLQHKQQAEWVSSSKIDRLIALLEVVRTQNESRNMAAVIPQAGLSTVLATKSKSDARLAGALKRLGPVGSAPHPPAASSSSALTSFPGSEAHRPEKVIVFSQWTAMLDLLEVPLNIHKFHFRRLDGTMTVPAREKAIIDFETCNDVMVLLVSLKAASLGVNLTVANHVVLMDLWWNPTVEEQAIDRAHRIGQTRTVKVTRIAIKDTVEDRILALQEQKRQMVFSALNEAGRSDAAQSTNKLTMDDLRFLFGLS